MSYDLLFAEANLDIIIPNSNSNDPNVLLASPQRDSVTFDEILHFYLLIRPSPPSQNPYLVQSDKLYRDFFSSLDISVQVNIGDVTSPSSGTSINISSIPSITSTPGPTAQFTALLSSNISPAPRSSISTPVSSTLEGGRLRAISFGGQSIRSVFSPKHPIQTSSHPPTSSPLLSPIPSNSIPEIAPWERDQARSLSSPAFPLPSSTTAGSTSLSGHQQTPTEVNRNDPTSKEYSGPKPANTVEVFQYQYAYNPNILGQEPLISVDGFCLYPLKVPIAFVQNNLNSLVPTISISVTVVQKPSSFLEKLPVNSEWCSNDNYEAINILDKLVDDPSFSSSESETPSLRLNSRLPSSQPSTLPPLKKVISKKLPIWSPVDVKVRVVPYLKHEKVVLVNLEIECVGNEGSGDGTKTTLLGNNVNVTIVKVDVDVKEGVTKAHGGGDADGDNDTQLPIILRSFDQVYLNYTVTLLSPYHPHRFPISNDYATSNPSKRPLLKPNFTISPSPSLSDIKSKFLTTSTTKSAEHTFDNTITASISIQYMVDLPGLKGQSITSKWECVVGSSALSELSGTTAEAQNTTDAGRGVMKKASLASILSPSPFDLVGVLPEKNSSIETDGGSIIMKSNSNLRRLSMSVSSPLSPTFRKNSIPSTVNGSPSGGISASAAVVSHTSSTTVTGVDKIRKKSASIGSRNELFQEQQIKVAALGTSTRTSTVSSSNSASSFSATMIKRFSFPSRKSKTLERERNMRVENRFQDDSEKKAAQPQGKRSVYPPTAVSDGDKISDGLLGKYDTNEEQDAIIVVAKVEPSTPLPLNKIFSLRFTFLNLSTVVRNFSVLVPVGSYAHADFTRESSPQVEVDGNNAVVLSGYEIVKRAMEDAKKEANIVCLENNIRLGPLSPNTTSSVTLHFVPLKPYLQRIPCIQLYDHDNEDMISLKDIGEVFVSGGEE